ncbi:MAG TPA: threonine synthase [Lentisphaeria bacterium]|nr:MAG: threonine synthase [Lentisphaerae bacterium GWF2_50_93]HCE43613.1 threonine synthase [Lentisphaeria bacterium]
MPSSAFPSWLECLTCSRKYDLGKVRYTCDCGGLLDLKRDLGKADGRKLVSLWEKRWGLKSGVESSGVWRYRELILDVPDSKIITKQEGNTRLYPAGRAGKYAGIKNFLLKHEGENPTGSFKDRGMTCGITAAGIYNAKCVACASTGNTSASMAAYAATAGIKSVIFIPSGKIAYGKLAQALAYGGLTLQIDGNFDDAMTLVQEICGKLNIYLLNSINPFRIEGQKAICFEILQQLDWKVPDWFVIPGGNLGNNSAFSKALMELHELGIIDKIPRIAVIQASGANPLYTMWKNNKPFAPVKNPETIATAIKIGNPVSWEKSLRGIKWSNGVVEQVTEQEIMDAKAMVDAAGIGAEPASCCSVAGAKKLVEAGIISKDESVVGILTGNVLKDPDAVINYHTDQLKNIKGTFANSPKSIKATLEAVKAAL